jgi:ribosomal protein S18 acetylase RimI-like enzyme
LIIGSRDATFGDIDALVALYDPALAEQTELREAWGIAEGLPHPIAESLVQLLDDEASLLLVGEIDGHVFGFLWARIEPMLPQAGGEEIGVVRLVYVEEEARGVGVGEAMLAKALDGLRRRGIRRFDAIVSPGHRLAKNFFESAGFSARRITMYHRDAADMPPGGDAE